MGLVIHTTVPVQVWVDVDAGIADAVRDLNTLEGVRTHTSCQGTIGEGGPNPYPARIEVSWNDDAALERIRAYCPVEVEGDHWGWAYPRQQEAMKRQGRDAIGIELNPAYIGLADDRTAGVQMSVESLV